MIPFFVAEVRKKDGSEYRAKSVFEFVLTIQTMFRVKKGKIFQFLKDPVFLPIRNSLNNVMKSLQRQGLGNNPRKCDIITTFMEETLWAGGHLGTTSSKQLLRTLVYLLGVNLGLRTGEHRQLRLGMFQVIHLHCILTSLDNL